MRWLLGIVLFVLPIALAAESAGTIDVVVENHLLNVGYEPLDPQAGSTTTLTFNLADAQTKTPTAFNEVEVQMHRGNDDIFSGTLVAKDGTATLAMVFPTPGNYTLELSYRNQGQTVVEGNLSLTVGGSLPTAPAEEDDDILEVPSATPSQWTPWLAGIFIGLVLGALMMMGRGDPRV